MMAMNQIKQLLLVCIVWANGNKENQFPASMEEAIKAANGTDQLLANPRQPVEKAGFNYVRPSDGLKADVERVVIYENSASGMVEFASALQTGTWSSSRIRPASRTARCRTEKTVPAGK